MEDTNRIVEIFSCENKEWEKKDFIDLKSGDIFRISDGNERYVNSNTGDNIWIATGEPYENHDGVLTVETLY